MARRKPPARTPAPAGDAAIPDAEAGGARRDAMLEAARGVFLRYGFKKTSMDDLARAAGLSRQGLYLHFQTKEALFKAALVHLLAQLQAAARAALARDDASFEDRLLAAFEAYHGQVVMSAGGGHLDELLATATALIGPHVTAMEHDFVTSVAGALAREGVAAAWRPAGVTAKDLAEMLCATSAGLKYEAQTFAAYRARMRAAVRVIVRGAAA